MYFPLQSTVKKLLVKKSNFISRFSYSAVHFALCHIYSGASNIPDSINIVELATLADMLCLEGLKEVIMYTLKVKYCHFFHKVTALLFVIYSHPNLFSLQNVTDLGCKNYYVNILWQKRVSGFKVCECK